MKLRDRARELAKEQVESVWRQMRVNGIDPRDERNWRGNIKAMRNAVWSGLERDRAYGSIEIWLYVFVTLAKVIWEIIRERQNEKWGEVGHA